MVLTTYKKQINIYIKYMWNCIKSLFCLQNTEDTYNEVTLGNNYSILRKYYYKIK